MQGPEALATRGHAQPLFIRRRFNMDVSAITQLIGTLGFPIAACIALFMQNAKESERHREEMERITEALNNNTVAITELSASLNRNV